MRKKLKSTDFISGMIFGSCIVCMILCFFIVLADVATEQAFHPAPYAIRHATPYTHPSHISDSRNTSIVSMSYGQPDYMQEEPVR